MYILTDALHHAVHTLTASSHPEIGYVDVDVVLGDRIDSEVRVRDHDNRDIYDAGYELGVMVHALYYYVGRCSCVGSAC